jgi:hypothetical protein
MTRSTDPATAVMVSDFRMSRRVGMGGPYVSTSVFIEDQRVSRSCCVKIVFMESAFNEIVEVKSVASLRDLFRVFPFTRHFRARLSSVVPSGLEQ